LWLPVSSNPAMPASHHRGLALAPMRPDCLGSIHAMLELIDDDIEWLAVTVFRTLW
jgi:hypothetical protein